jgi:PTS system ascorbate-specific IIA component
MANCDVAVVLVTHAPLGTALRSVIEHVYGESAKVTVIDVLAGACADDSTDSLLERMKQLDCGAGVLLLTDLPGASPANICKSACASARKIGIECDVVSGVNPSMVLRAISHCSEGLAKATTLAIEGAAKSIRHAD